LIGSARLFDVFLLAQEGTPLHHRIGNQDRQQCSHRCNKKHFHSHRIAWNPKIALYSEFAIAKQKCNGQAIGMEK
jgi:hypothetical protein